MKKILHMTPPDINNGVYRYIFNHMQYMDLEKYQFSFLTKNPAGLVETKEFQRYGFSIHAFRNVERENPQGLRDEIMRILSDGFDAIHLHTSYWRGFLIEQIAMEMKLPRVIVHSHSSGIDVIDEQERKALLEKHNFYKEKFSLEYATDVCACSGLAGDWLYGKQIPEKAIRILPNAIEVRKYHFQPQVREKMRSSMGVADKIVIGNVGRYCYQKNQEFLLRVFAKAHAVNTALFLLLIGQGEHLSKLKSLAKELKIEKDVCFLGWQNHIERYLQAMDVFCLPSVFEGLAISAVEAQAAGLPCLLSDTVDQETSVTDLVKFLPLQEEIWQESLLRCTNHFSREHRDDEIAKRGYDIQVAARGLEDFYDEYACNLKKS